MKIYNKVIIDIETGKTIYEDSYDYIGPITQCYGGDVDRDDEDDQDVGLGGGGPRDQDVGAGRGSVAAGLADERAHGASTDTAIDTSIGMGGTYGRGVTAGRTAEEEDSLARTPSGAHAIMDYSNQQKAPGFLGKLGLTNKQATVAKTLISAAALSPIGVYKTIKDVNKTYTEAFEKAGVAPEHISAAIAAGKQDWGPSPGESQVKDEGGRTELITDKITPPINELPVDTEDSTLTEQGYSEDDIRLLRNAPKFYKDLDPYLLLKINPVLFNLMYTGELQHAPGGQTTGVEKREEAFGVIGEKE